MAESGNSSFRDFRRASLWKWASLIGCLSPTWMDELPALTIKGMAGRDWGYASGPDRVFLRAARLQISIDTNDGEDPPT